MPERSSFDEVMLETNLASVGPSVPPTLDAKAQAMARKTTEAWTDERIMAAFESSVANGSTTPSIKRKPLQKLALCIVLIQALWAIVVPIKNIGTVYYPSTRPDSTRTSAIPYNYEKEQPLVFPGKDLVSLLNNVLEIALSNYAVQKELEASGTSDIDRIYNLISLEEFAVMSQYDALVLQSSEFPANGGIFGDIEIDLACSEENAFVTATRCTGSDGYPCPGDYPQDGETRTFEDVDLPSLSNSTGLENSVGLLYMAGFFHQAMSTLFAAKDWTAALENLNYIQSVDDALDAGSLSGYKDNTPVVLEQDAFLVAVQAAQVETTNLSSCIASELVVSQFYTRSFILDLIQIPSTTEAILKPVFAFDLHITSGIQFGTIQVAGLSMRMLQNMGFFPEISSAFESKTMKDTSGEEYDYQNYKLIGATASGIDDFKDSSTGANTWMVYPLAEIGTLTAPKDSWWDEELEYASWFQTQEADMTTAPFRVFNTHLNISSTARIAPVDDNTETRCHRALFKVLGKIAYLALVELSKPTSCLMFMSEVSVDHRTWLLNHAFTKELVGENFFGDCVSFPYRSGAFTRKDDGSSWAVIPLLSAMIEHFGASDTLASILQELDRSLTAFVKASNGDLQFPDAASCHINGIDATTQTATASDRVNEIYAKIYPGLEASVTDLLALVPGVYAAMGEAMASKRIYVISLTSEQILGNPVITQSTEGFGAPYDWKPTAFTAGMLKFWPPKTPLKETVQQLRDATRCYRMLELRYLNVTTRCFAEPNNVQIRRRTYESEAMRKFFLSNWSMAVMLNTMAWVIVLKYLEELQKAWRVTKFECLDVEVALQLNLQGMGALDISQSLLLLTVTLPSLIGFHLPNDVTFTPHFRDEQLPKVAIDLLVTVSMSWFVKVGFEFCNNRISPKRPADWYYQFRLRWLTLVLIFVLRLITPARSGSRDGSYQMWKLVFTCLISLFLSACNTCVIFLPERRGGVIAGDRKQGHDAVLVKQNLPLNRYEFEVYLINNGGKFVSALASAGVAVGGSSLLVSLIAAIAASSSSSSSSTTSSNGSLMFETLLMINQGQFITLLGSLNLQGAPRFFYEVCKKFAWTNLQFFPKETSSVITRALLAADTNNGETTTVKGVQRYAQLVGVNADHLFYCTCLAVAAACAAIVVLYFILWCGIQLCKKDHEALTNHLSNRVIWATILLLLVLQYILAMTSSFQIYYSITAHRATGGLVLAFFVLISSCLGFVAFGVLKISRYSHELEDLGTEMHEKKPFNHKYGAYYEDFTRENRYFFVAKIGLEILSGCVVGIVQNPMYQIGSLVALNVAFLVLVIARDPYLVRLFFYACILSGYLRVTLLLLSIIQSSPDIFPQRTRNFVAELAIGLNALLFMCLLVRQIYTMTRALYKWCQSSDASSSSQSFSESSRDASWRSGTRSDSRSSSSKGKQGNKTKKRKDEYEARFTLQQLIASKIREDPPPVTPLQVSPLKRARKRKDSSKCCPVYLSSYGRSLITPLISLCMTFQCPTCA